MSQVIEKAVVDGANLLLVQGDITEEHVDAIVNAANSALQHGGGVAGAISRKGGPDIQRESNAIGRVPVGKAAMTGSGRLPCKMVIHAVGPRWGEGNEDAKLRSAVRSSLELAAVKGCRTVSLPAISSGIFGFPKDLCAEILLDEARAFLTARSGVLAEVRFCLYDAPTIGAFRAAWQRAGLPCPRSKS